MRLTGRAIPRFPAQVTGGPGVGVAKANGIWSIGLDTANLIQQPLSNPVNSYVAVLLPDGSYAKVPAAAISNPYAPLITAPPPGEDATSLIQDALGAYGLIQLEHGATYEIRTTVAIPANGGIYGNGATLYMPSAYFNNTDPNSPARYGTTSVGLNVSGSLTDYNFPIDQVTVKDLQIVGDFVDGFYNMGVLVRNATNILIENVTVRGFAVGRGICLAACRANTRVIGCRVADWLTNINWGSATAAQATAFELDNDAIAGNCSTGVKFDNCEASRIIQGPVAVAAQGDQSDGFNIVGHASLGVLATHGTMLNNCLARFVGDGFDSSGGQGDVFTNVVAEDCTNYGLKLVHGCSGGAYSNFTLKRIGIVGLGIGSSALGACLNNSISNGLITEIDPNNVVGTETACIALTEVTTQAHNNLIDNVVCKPGANGKYVFMTRLIVGGTNYVRGIFDARGTVGWVNTSGTSTLGLVIAASNCTNVQASMNSTQTIDATNPTINFDIESIDARGEFNTTTHAWTCQLPGNYTIVLACETTATSAGNLHEQTVLNGAATIAMTRFTPANSAAFTLPLIRIEARFEEGQVLTAKARTGGGSYTMNNAGTLTYLSIRPANA